jgi:hypothetical protein
MLAGVHWQAGDRPLPAPKVTVAGESALLADCGRPLMPMCARWGGS